ncbi:bifunctional diguanylate cyclase/phosphodiesterase [Thermosulfurimonas dismutans]|uniref:Diguanylate cyclase/phosphodiesterase (GGDEF & EAL domains) with PAS/PAC sensor(S) n=1 Tax=Thermosulfurimonas dismutans TaxID=999894 RepID=A0A179D824_9BACT|nr:GGDEF domain-containing phosphodiesterase [Thermosulfurimonas dismutans]OAQ21738.1 diguanylate cyclase/phosphodiesterase (GGDEF & EAL domains) with PAS/PAC sensor(s) [Thermosulfurimonas dismutans]
MLENWDSLKPQCEKYLESFPVGIYVVEVSVESESIRFEKIKFLNAEVERLTGWSRKEIEAEPYWWFNNLHPEDRPKILKLEQKLLESNERGSHLYRFRKKSGDYLWIKDYFSVISRDDSRFLLAGLWLDFSREKALEEELQEKEAFFRLFVTKAPVAILLYDERIIYANPYVEKLTGYPLEELRKKYIWELATPSHREAIKEIVARRLRGEKIPKYYHEFVILTKDGQEKVGRFYAETVKYKGRYLGLAIGFDITPEKTLKKRLVEVAFFDPLTGLPNRDLFIEKLKILLAKARRRKEGLMVAILDLVKFREINATFGFENGNTILRQVGERLKRTLREGDVKSRFFADKFGLVLTELRTPYGIWVVMEKLKKLFKQPFRVGDRDLYLSANIGVALFPRDGTKAEELLQKAEIALKRAKESGENYFAFYSPEMEKELLEDAFFRNALVEGLRRQEFFLEYQPILNLRTKRVIGVEALIRWRHPELGLISPAKFIPVAEKSGFIFELEEFILSQSLKEMALLSNPDLFLAINFSGRQFRDPKLPEKIEAALKGFDFPPEKFILEITETAAMEDAERSRKILSNLREIGIKIALDDFGIGYSSMEYLIEFEVDKIKIDRSFVTAMLKSEKALKVINTVIELSHGIGVSCLAEGIENKEQLEKLICLGCDEGQGFYFAPPMGLEALTEFLSRCGQ